MRQSIIISMFLRHLLSIAILPFTVTVLVPAWVARTYRISFRVGANPPEILFQICGAASLMVGLALFAGSLHQFAVRGRGTLAPWDPPTKLVVQGPYRYVRNPMISGVIFILVAEALMLLSWPHAFWALAFLTINLIYIPLFEETSLETRFGDTYREYCRNVGRIVPRRRPWTPTW